MAKRAVWPLNLGYGHFAILVITVLVVIPIVVWIALGESIRSAYLAQVVAPRLKTQYGFEVGQVRAGHGESGDVTWEAITSVAQGGVLERAGMRRVTLDAWESTPAASRTCTPRSSYWSSSPR